MFSVLSINLLVVFAKASNRPLTVPIKVAQNLYLEDLCIKNLPFSPINSALQFLIRFFVQLYAL